MNIMHELSICHHMLKVIEKYAEKNDLRKITKVWIDVGALAGIDIDALKFSFPIAMKNTCAENATLFVHVIAGLAFCHACNKNFNINQYLQTCPGCDAFDYVIKQGKTLQIAKIGGV